MLIKCCIKSKSKFVNLKRTWMREKTVAEMKFSSVNRVFHFSFNLHSVNLMKSTERRSSHLKCLCLCTCSLEKLLIQQGFSCYTFYFHHSCIFKHRPFKTPTAVTVLPAAQDLLVFWRPSGSCQKKKSAKGSFLTATQALGPSSVCS